MIVFFIAFSILTLSAGCILALSPRVIRLGVAWLWSAGAAFVSWIMMIFLRQALPDRLTLKVWTPAGTPQMLTAFHLDAEAWIFLTTFLAVLLAGVLTDAARISPATRPALWAGALAMGALSFGALTADNAAAFVFSWVVLDGVELVVFRQKPENPRAYLQYAMNLGFRALGSLVIIIGLLMQAAEGETMLLSNAPATVSLLYLVGAGLRLGVFPITMIYENQPSERTGISNLMRMLVSMSALLLLTRLPAASTPPHWRGVLITLALVIILYGGVMMLQKKNAQRPFWILALSGFAFLSTLKGNAALTPCWAAVMAGVGSLNFLNTSRGRIPCAAVLMGAVLLAGAPGSLILLGWTGLSATGFDISTLIAAGGMVLVLTGLAENAIDCPEDEFAMQEGWIRLVYMLGFFNLLLSLIIEAIWSGAFALLSGWWIGVAVLILAAALIFIRKRKIAVRLPLPKPLKLILEDLGKILSGFFGFTWLYRILFFLYSLLQRLVNSIVLLFEGEGGVLWSLLLLALLASVLGGGGQ